MAVWEKTMKNKALGYFTAKVYMPILRAMYVCMYVMYVRTRGRSRTGGRPDYDYCTRRRNSAAGQSSRAVGLVWLIRRAEARVVNLRADLAWES